MKRVLVVTALVLVISISLVAGTLAMYVIELDDLAEGSVVAKEFILEPGDTDIFEDDVKIAPGETVDWKFSVKNYNGTIVSETAMDLDFAIELAAADEKDAIEPLVVTVKDEDEAAITLVQGLNSGAWTFTDEFGLNETGQEKSYTVSIAWPWETEDVDDIDYAGAGNATAVKVSVTGTQAATSSQP